MAGTTDKVEPDNRACPETRHHRQEASTWRLAGGKGRATGDPHPGQANKSFGSPLWNHCLPAIRHASLTGVVAYVDANFSETTFSEALGRWCGSTPCRATMGLLNRRGLTLGTRHVPSLGERLSGRGGLPAARLKTLINTASSGGRLASTSRDGQAKRAKRPASSGHPMCGR